MSPRDVRNENPNHHHDFYQLGDPTFVHGDLYFLPSRKIWQFNQSSNGDGGMSFELFHGKIWHFARENKRRRGLYNKPRVVHQQTGKWSVYVE